MCYTLQLRCRTPAKNVLPNMSNLATYSGVKRILNAPLKCNMATQKKPHINTEPNTYLQACIKGDVPNKVSS